MNLSYSIKCNFSRVIEIFIISDILRRNCDGSNALSTSYPEFEDVKNHFIYGEIRPQD
jgi:hypothetical protein